MAKPKQLYNEKAYETDLTDEEKATIYQGRKAHEAGEYVSLNLLYAERL